MTMVSSIAVGRWKAAPALGKSTSLTTWVAQGPNNGKIVPIEAIEVRVGDIKRGGEKPAGTTQRTIIVKIHLVCPFFMLTALKPAITPIIAITIQYSIGRMSTSSSLTYPNLKPPAKTRLV